MIVNVKEKATGSYVYTIQINENKTRKQPSTTQATDIGAGLKSREAASLFSIIPRNERDVKPLEEKKLTLVCKCFLCKDNNNATRTGQSASNP
jgi:hypothetical protein